MPDWKKSNFEMYKPYLSHFFGQTVTVQNVTDRKLQTMGYDLLVQTNSGIQSGTIHSVEEKTRLSSQFYPDVAIEYWTGDRQGWVYSLKSNFLFYHYVAGNRLLIMRPFELRQLWLKYGEHYKWEFGTLTANNDWTRTGYKTEFCPVPISELANKIWLMGYSPNTPQGKLLTRKNHLYNWIGE